MAWKHTLSALDRWLLHVERVAIAGAVIGLVIMMVLISFDALGRYLFAQPLVFTFDLVANYLMPATMFLAFSLTFRIGGHVSVSVFAAMMPMRVRTAVSALVLALSTLLVAGMFLEGLHRAWNSWIREEVTTGAIAWPIWASEIWVPLGAGLLLLRLIQTVLWDLMHAVTGTEDPDRFHAEA